MEAFSTEQVCRLSGASPRQLDYWARLSILTPSLRAANGSGSQRRYSLADAECARVLVRLAVVTGSGDMARFAPVVENLRKGWTFFAPTVHVNTAGLMAPVAALFELGDGLVIDLDAARAHVAAELQGMRAEERVRVLVG